MKEIKTVTVLGANGTMGANVAGIFAAFSNAKVYMVCRNYHDAVKAVSKACMSVRADSIRKNLVPADYQSLEACIRASDLIFESTSENLEVKKAVYLQISNLLNDHCILCSGTSGLSITILSEFLPINKRSRFFGVHMFNPPYKMPLCELISTKYTDAEVKQELRFYLESILYRTVVEVSDSPAFLANRIGFMLINVALQRAEQMKDYGGVDYIDAIMGPFSGRNMAPLRTCDFVGLDVHKAIVENIYHNTDDYAKDCFTLPTFVSRLIDRGYLGRKAGKGIYRTELLGENKKNHLVYDIASDSFRKRINYSFPFAEKMKAALRVGEYVPALQTLVHNRSKEAELCLELLLQYAIYAISTAREVAVLRSADDVMATGFNWCPPLALLEGLAGVTDVKALVKERLDTKLLSGVDIDSLFADLPASAYDYRSFFRSSR